MFKKLFSCLGDNSQNEQVDLSSYPYSDTTNPLHMVNQMKPTTLRPESNI